MTTGNILVTGGAGYIGSHVALELAKTGLTPVVLDNLSTGHAEAVRWGPLVVGDLADQPLIEKALKDHNIRAVIHLAASAQISESFQMPDLYFTNNVANTIILLNAMKKHGTPHLVFSSTCAVYGAPVAVPIPETHAARPINPYGESKLMAENIIKAYSSRGYFRHISLRYFNASGADSEGEIGESHKPEFHLIPAALAAARSSSELRVFGNDYPTGDGTAIRDYIHVSDLAKAHVLGLQYLTNGGHSATLNLGSEQGYSVRQVIAAVESYSGRTLKVQNSARREGDPPVLIADSSGARRLLNWYPEASDLETIVKSAAAWNNKQHKPERHKH